MWSLYVTLTVWEVLVFAFAPRLLKILSVRHDLPVCLPGAYW
nr:MAG TPA: hypothetical protein [Caudoviricetes sp.]